MIKRRTAVLKYQRLSEQLIGIITLVYDCQDMAQMVYAYGWKTWCHLSLRGRVLSLLLGC